MSDTPWYRWFAADYRRKTLHLSFIEDAAYRRMIDAYMDRRGPLPADRSSLYRLCSAQDELERAAVDRVAAEFFNNGNNTLKHDRCDRELRNQKVQAEQRHKSAEHAARTRWAMRTQCGKMPDSDSDSDSDSKPHAEPDSKTAKSKPLRPPRTKKPSGDGSPSVSSAVWEAYSTAYFNRYCTEPVRNARVNGMLANFVSRIPADSAAAVAAAYVRSDKPRYCKEGHSIGLMLNQAETLHTEWANGGSHAAASNPFAQMLRERQNAKAD